MKPNQEQLTTIENILGDVSKYRETYEELYDHILSALDAVPDDEPFVDALYHIVENELGGGRGIGKMEEKYRKAAVKGVAKVYFKYFGQYLVSPYIIILIALTWGFYLIVDGRMINQAYTITILCFATNTLLMKARSYFIRKARKDTSYGKSSVISIIYPYIAMLPMCLFIVFSIVYLPLRNFNLISQDALIFMYPTVFFINLVNMLAYYRLCKDEFKIITTT